MMMSAESETKSPTDMKFTVTLVVNATFSVWENKPGNSTDTNANWTVACLFLIALCSLCMNLCLILCISCSYSLKRVSSNVSIFSIALSCLLDSTVNIPFAIYIIKSEFAVPHQSMCSSNATLIQILTIVMAWEMAALCTENCVSFSKRSQSSIGKQVIVTTSGWIVSIIVSIPIVSGYSKAYLSPETLSCTVMRKENFYYIIAFIAIFTVTNVVTIFTMFVTFLRQFRAQKALNYHRHEMTYTEQFFEESYLRNHLKNTKFVCAIIFLYSLLFMPFSISQFYFPMASMDSTTLLKTDDNESEMYNTHSMSSYFLWMRFIFDLILPIVALAVKRDVSKKCYCLFAICNGKKSRRNADFASRCMREPLTDSLEEAMVSRDKRRQSCLTLLSDSLAQTSLNGHSLFQHWSSSSRTWDNPISPEVQKRDVDRLVNSDHPMEEYMQTELYQDITEEEINFSEVCTPKSVREVAVQTIREASDMTIDINFQTAGIDAIEMIPTKHSPLFTCQQAKNWCARAVLSQRKRKGNRYRQFGSEIPSFDEIKNREFDGVVSDDGLVSVLRMKNPSCVVLPRSTAELLDAIVDNRGVVSL